MNKTKENLNYYIIIGGLFLLQLFLHLYRLGSLPFAINVDEAGLWYNVKNLLSYGVDQGNNSWPLLITNYYGEQSAMYTYLALICCKLFGDTLFVVRLPAVLNACLIFIFGYKIVNQLYKNPKVNILYCVFCTILPYFVINGRIAMDCNLMLGFSTMFLWFFIKAVEDEKWYYYLIAGVMCGVVFYTYAISYITIPLFVLFSGLYLLYHKKLNWKQCIAFLTPIILLGIPLLLIQLINIFEWNEIEVLGITLTNFESPRHSEMGLTNVLARIIVYGKYVFMGDDVPLITSKFFCSNFYIISIPALLIGLVQIIKRKGFSLKKFILFWVIAAFGTIMVITTGGRGYHINSIMFGCVILIIEGFVWAFEKIKNEKCKKIALVIFAICYLVSFCGFCFHYYVGTYNENAYFYEFSDEGIDDVLKDVQNENKVYFAVKSVYYKLATNKNPVEHPFIYNRLYDETGTCIAVQEQIYEDNGFVFDFQGKFLNNIESDAVYVIPVKQSNLLKKMQSYSGFEMKQIGCYAIFRPTE